VEIHRGYAASRLDLPTAKQMITYVCVTCDQPSHQPTRLDELTDLTKDGHDVL